MVGTRRDRVPAPLTIWMLGEARITWVLMIPAGLEGFERARVEADCRYNDALTALDRAVVELGTRPRVTGDDARHLGSLLLVFLQQLTAYVDTRDRMTSATMVAEVEAVRRALD